MVRINILFLSIVFAFSLHGEEKSEQKVKPSHKELKRLAGRLASTKSQLVEEEKHQRKILGTLYSINKKMKTMAEKRSTLTDKVLSSQSNVKALAHSIARLESDAVDQKRGLSKRLRTLYMLSGHGSLRIIFGSQSGQELDRNLKYLKILSDRDYKLIQNYETSLKILKAQREKLNQKVKKLVTAQNHLKNQENLLSKQQASKSKLLNKLRTSRRAYLERLKGLRARTHILNSSAKIKELEGLLEPTFFEQKGLLSGPVAAAVTKKYGLQQDEDFGFQLLHKGLFYASSLGSQVRGVFTGTVAFAGKLPGYGKSIVLDHGDHYYTVYSHFKDIAVKSGEKISSGDLLGSTGVDHSSREAGLYFEIRHFSDAINPEGWFRQEDTGPKQL